MFKNEILTFEGEFKDGNADGEGLITYKTGEKLEGLFRENEPFKVILNYNNGDIYDGEMKDGEWSG